MKIGMIAPLEMRVPPQAYGGTELVVSLLTDGLVRAGHDVTLFASGNSMTSAKLVPGSERHLRGTTRDKGILVMLNALNCFERAHEFDVIHNHTLFEGLSLAGLVQTPVLTTLHGPIEGDWQLLFRRYRGWYNAISRSALSLLPSRNRARCAGVVYNAIDVHSYPFNDGAREDFLLFLSRMSPQKAPHLAIEVARLAGKKLVVAGNVDTPDRDYFERQVLPAIDGQRIVYVGEADYRTKRDLLMRARCLLAPITWEEPFGLFMVEAAAAGTPTIAFRRGAAGEVVADGVSGCLVNSVEEMAAAVSRIDRIAPLACRKWALENFHVDRMIRDYVAVYERMLANRSAVPDRGRALPAVTDTAAC